MDMGQAFSSKLCRGTEALFPGTAHIKRSAIYLPAIVTAKNIEILDEVLIHQRRDNQNSLSNTREQSWTCFYEALLELREELKKRGLYHELEQDYINYALHFSLWNLETLNGPKKKELYQILKKTWFHELGIRRKKAFYFYQKGEYRKYQNIRKKSWRVYEQEQR